MARKAQYVHFSGRAQLTDSLSGHLEGREDSRPIEALTRPGLERSIDLGAEPERARLVVAQAKANRAASKTGGRRPLECVEAIFCGPPAWEDETAWPTDDVKAWARDSIKWLRSVLPPGTPLATAHLHTDETSPHVHPSFPPALPDSKGVTALSWKRMQAYMAERAAGRPIPSPSGQMRALQDSYWREVGKPYGLKRGQVGEAIKYAPLDRTKGVLTRMAGAEARLAEERERRAEADRRKAEAEADRRKAEADAARERDLRLETERRTAAERAERTTPEDPGPVDARIQKFVRELAKGAEKLHGRLETEQRRANDAVTRASAADALAKAAVERADKLEADLEAAGMNRAAAERAATAAVKRADKLEADLEAAGMNRADANARCRDFGERQRRSRVERAAMRRARPRHAPPAATERRPARRPEVKRLRQDEPGPAKPRGR